ncbi:MAG: hypothetical protein M8860_12925 [marine benthic group bacterium]|nr:hypothetical protein [Candidatus Carthagonibacter metallireducens]
MTDRSGWIVLAEFGARWEAELLVGALRAAKIPVLIDGPDTALFGPGFSGGFAPGVVVRVPREFSEHAEEIRSVFDSGPYIPLDDPDNDDEAG